MHRLLFDCLPCWNETSLVDNSLKCSIFTKDWTHVQFKTVTSYVIKNKTKKNNYFTWDNRTWDKRTTQCIDRTETKDGTKIGQRCYVSRWDDKLCTLSQVRYFEWESKIILIPQEQSQLFPSTPLFVSILCSSYSWSLGNLCKNSCFGARNTHGTGAIGREAWNRVSIMQSRKKDGDTKTLTTFIKTYRNVIKFSNLGNSMFLVNGENIVKIWLFCTT